jgi:transposase
MSLKYEYHQILKYLYHEGYASSYEDAEYIVENMSDEQYEELYENVFKSPSKPASSAESAREAAKTHKTAAATATNSDDRRRHRNAAAGYEVTARRMTADHYEFLSDYLINENFAPDLNAAYAIIESMSEEWMISIFEQNLNEVTGLGRVLFRGLKAAAQRGMRIDPDSKAAIKSDILSQRADDLKNYMKYDLQRRSPRGTRVSPTAVKQQARNNPEIKRLEDRSNTIEKVRAQMNRNNNN